MEKKDDDLGRLWSLIEDDGFCMMVTRDGDVMRSRPMASYVDREAGLVRFLSKRTDHKIEELHEGGQRECDVALAYSDHDRKQYVSISGRSTITADRAMVERLWGPHADIWFGGDPQTADVVVIEVRPVLAEYWDNDANAIRTIFETAKAYVGDQPPDLGDNAKLKMAG